MGTHTDTGEERRKFKGSTQHRIQKQSLDNGFRASHLIEHDANFVQDLSFCLAASKGTLVMIGMQNDRHANLNKRGFSAFGFSIM